MKKDVDTVSGGSTPRRRGRQAVQYAIALIGCALVINALVGDKGVLQIMKTRQEAETLARTVAAIQADNARMRAEINRIHDDPAALEEIARRDLQMIKPGERLFIIRDAPPADKRPGDK